PDLSDFHNAWNKLIACVRRNTPVSSDDIQVKQTSGGTSFHIRKRIAYGGEGGSPQQPITLGIYDVTGNTPYSANSIVYVPSAFTLNGVGVLPGTYGCVKNTPINPIQNQIPQIPAP